jgi:hypothetical protein
MEKARDELVDLLIQYKRLKSHDITVVFDGYIAGAGGESVAVRGGVTVIYSKLAEKADEVIKRIVTTDRKEWIVVTSDKDVARHAWSVNSIPVPSDEFIRIISRRLPAPNPSREGIRKAADEKGISLEVAGWKDSDEEDDGAHVRKGNPYKLSKKEKSVRRALSKL